MKQSAVKASAIWARQPDNGNVGGCGSTVVRSGEEEVGRMLCEMMDMDIVMEPEQVCDSRISACNYLAMSQVKRIQRRGDGNCLLYSLLGADNLEEANRWRQRIADWIEYNIDECVIPEVPIRELVEQEGG